MTPLADRMRPASLDEILGQDHLVGPGAPFRRALESGRLRSCVLWGPPGTGKTTIARCLAAAAGMRFVQLSAVLSGTKDLKEVIEAIPALDPRGTLLFVDEIHRWNKAQQDALLPHVESGKVVLVGATTENPAFHLIPALRSRTELLILERIGRDDLVRLLERALTDERGLAGKAQAPEEGLLRAIAAASDGDARRALGLLERLADRGPLTLVALKSLGVAVFHDKDGDAHYDVVSAFIKSMRGSDPDAAVYWLARMLEGGEDPVFAARRMVIFASEDVGNADPRALELAVSAMEGAARIGMPEARILLGQAATYLATAPKSNASYKAINAALEEVRASGALPVPLHIRNAPTGLAKQLGHGAGYKYPHDFPDHIARQQYLPDELVGRRFYVPVDAGAEKTIRERLAWWEKRLKERGE
ncbi:MAG: replication-associated recombination protein A [Myxococcota bacterium]